ncbi:zinc/cadmium/mercury/lead-transporting ATPase [Erwinia endophytica]|uniref:zinc/cadmium/mercury/lead-transporting ATPase n=1 Tax=Erwinia endophytica TaxID=1563158 RepID=UPI001265F0C9|nr:zinc/cadmium/mercury/lead-transporting ATPase [Erwinia endophytica]KAB8312431.1 zinc/cadmium/mercury/lead-transporting ATPase [Erwinia endophytica]
MHQHASSCQCGHCHAERQHGCSNPPRPAINKITAIRVPSAASGCCGNEDCANGDSPDEESDKPGSDPSYSWQVDGMDCPSCAKKIENAVNQLPSVTHARVLFATEKLVVNASQDIRQQVERAVQSAGFSLKRSNTPPSVEPAPAFWQENALLLILGALMMISWLLQQFNPQAGKIAFTISTLFGAWPIARSALRLMRSGTPFAIETLMTIAAIGALFIGATTEAAMVLLLFMLGERLESYAASRARRGVTALMALKPEEAVRINGGSRESIALSELRPGDIIEVAPGSRLPADACLISPWASFDESALTGESIPVERQQGEVIAAGSLSVDTQVQLKVVSRPGESAIDRILHLIEEAEAHRAPVERFLDHFSRIYTPIIMVLALLVAILPPLLLASEWQPWIYKGLTLLLIGCPCALVISTPAAITSGLAAASRRGVLIKGGAALESLNAIRILAFDKTGTLTEGKPQVTAIVSLNGESEAVLLAKAAAVEGGSSHPLAKAIVALAEARQVEKLQASAQKALPGSGVEALVSDHKLLICAPARLADHPLSAEQSAQVAALESGGNTVVVMLQDTQPIALISLRDTLRADAVEALRELRSLNIQTVMLTGDNPRAAAAIAGELGIDYRAGLLPADKVAAIGELNQQSPVAMVGDGINDAPAMKAATAGIAMGNGSDVALEAADAALTHNRLNGLATMIRLSRATHATIRQNITLALGLKGVFLVTTLLGITGLWLAVLADSGATALVTANALRLLRQR